MSSSSSQESSQGVNQKWQIWWIERFGRNKKLHDTTNRDHETKRGEEIDKNTDLDEHLKRNNVDPGSLIPNRKTAYGCFKKGTLPNFDDDDDNYNGGRYIFVIKNCNPGKVNKLWKHMVTCLMDGDKFDENILGAKVHWNDKDADFKFELWTKERLPKDKKKINQELKKKKLEELNKLLNLNPEDATLCYQWHSDRTSFAVRPKND